MKFTFKGFEAGVAGALNGYDYKSVLKNEAGNDVTEKGSGDISASIKVDEYTIELEPSEMAEAMGAIKELTSSAAVFFKEISKDERELKRGREAWKRQVEEIRHRNRMEELELEVKIKNNNK